MPRNERNAQLASALSITGTVAAAGIAICAAAYAFKRVRSGGDRGRGARSAPAASAAGGGSAAPRAQRQAPAGPPPAVPDDPAATEAFEQLDELFQKRIAFIDGAMGTSIQEFKLSEEHFRGDRCVGRRLRHARSMRMYSTLTSAYSTE